MAKNLRRVNCRCYSLSSIGDYFKLSSSAVSYGVGKGRKAIISFKSPWQNPFVERIVGTLRRECFDHMIILNERHLRRILKEYSEYYNEIRPHLSLNRNSPIPRTVETIGDGEVIATPVLGGLHHCYSRAV